MNPLPLSLAAPYVTGGGYAGNKLKTAMRGNGQWTIEIVERSDVAGLHEFLHRPLKASICVGVRQYFTKPLLYRNMLRRHFLLQPDGASTSRTVQRLDDSWCRLVAASRRRCPV